MTMTVSIMGNTDFVSIRLCGIDDATANNRDGYIHVYGIRDTDAACRLVGIAVSLKVSADIMAQAEYAGTLPTVEVEDNKWFYVAVTGPSHFEKGYVPS